MDASYLACAHHSMMVAAICMFPSKEREVRVLLIGLGGGGLAMFMAKQMKKVRDKPFCTF